MSKKRVRVVIPRNADKLIELGEDIVAEHTELGADSPLNGLDMVAFSARVTAAKAKNLEQKKLRKDAETATEDRDDLLGKKKDQSVSTPGTVLNFVTRSRDMLLGAYKGNESHLGDFGFEVNQSNSGSGNKGNGNPPVAEGKVSGTVKQAGSMNPVAGATVLIVGTTISATTDEQGNFLLTKVPVGSQTLKVIAPMNQEQQLPVEIVAGSDVTINVLLVPSP